MSRARIVWTNAIQRGKFGKVPMLSGEGTFTGVSFTVEARETKTGNWSIQVIVGGKSYKKRAKTEWWAKQKIRKIVRLAIEDQAVEE